MFLESRSLDNAQMVYDFGLMKGTIKQFIDSMDHCYLLCDKDKPEFQQFIRENCDRYIVMPFNPSAEMLSVFIFKFVEDILKHTQTSNGESNINVKAVRYHETTTGYAECDAEDAANLWKDDWGIEFSKGVNKDWSDDLESIMVGNTVTNPVIPQQIEL